MQRVESALHQALRPVPVRQIFQSCRTRTELVVVFLAVLELLKIGRCCTLSEGEDGNHDILRYIHAGIMNKRRYWEATLLFLSGQPLSLPELCTHTGWSEEKAEQTAHTLAAILRDEKRGLILIQVAGGYQLVTSGAA